MERQKRIILIGESDAAPRDLVQNLLLKYTNCFLDFYTNAERLIKVKTKKSAPQTETIIILNICTTEAECRKNIEVLNSSDFKSTPKIVIMQEHKNDLLLHCYRQYISNVILLPENKNLHISHLENVLDFYLLTVKLPRDLRLETEENLSEEITRFIEN